MSRHRKRRHDRRVAHQRQQRAQRDNTLLEIQEKAKAQKKGKSWIQQQMLARGYELRGNTYRRAA